METKHKDDIWVKSQDVPAEIVASDLERKILAYCDGLMCVENHFQAGAIGSLHQHPHTQITYVVEGVFEFTIGEETRVVRKGDTMLKQGGIIHGCKCLEAGILLDIFSPMREDFV